jgi:hypothetical protein
MEIERLKAAAQQQQPTQQVAALAAYHRAFPWMEAPTFIDLSQKDEDNHAT